MCILKLIQKLFYQSLFPTLDPNNPIILKSIIFIHFPQPNATHLSKPLNPLIIHKPIPKPSLKTPKTFAFFINQISKLFMFLSNGTNPISQKTSTTFGLLTEPNNLLNSQNSIPSPNRTKQSLKLQKTIGFFTNPNLKTSILSGRSKQNPSLKTLKTFRCYTIQIQNPLSSHQTKQDPSLKDQI